MDNPDTFVFCDGRGIDWARRLRLKRRRLLQAFAAGAGALATHRTVSGLLPTGASGSSIADAVEEAPWPTIGAVQAHLFPSEPNAPGAREVNALSYLQRILSFEDRESVEDRNFIIAGATWLRQRVALDHDRRQLNALSETEREKVLRRMATGSADGETWIMLVLYYVLEALLSDPVYGGNPDGIGWKWLGYVAGFPRPPEGKRYWELRGR